MKYDPIFTEDLEKITEELVTNCDFRNKNFFITGVTGLIGSILVKAICEANEKNHMNIGIYCLVRNREKALKVFENVKNRNELNFIEGDILNSINIKVKLDYIIHAASITTSKIFIQKPVETLLTIVQGTKNILELAKTHEVKKMLYISSMEVYGITDSANKLITETDLGYIDFLNVRSSYSEGKRAAECLCKCYEAEYKIPVTIARLAQTFGAGIDIDDTRVFAQFARSVVQGNDIILHTSGESIGNYCYTSDCIRGLIQLLALGADGEAYTVANEECTTSIREMAEMLANKISNGRIKINHQIPDDSEQYGYAPNVTTKLDSSKLRKLGWKPEINLEASYIRMLKSYLSQKKIQEEDMC